MSAFKMDLEYRQTDEYKEWVRAIKHDYPSMPLYLIEQSIIFHKTNPQHYKTARDAKDVFKNAPVQKVNQEQKIIEDAIKVEEPPCVEPCAIEEL
jgi:hypothetical protein